MYNNMYNYLYYLTILFSEAATRLAAFCVQIERLGEFAYGDVQGLYVTIHRGTSQNFSKEL